MLQVERLRQGDVELLKRLDRNLELWKVLVQLFLKLGLQFKQIF